MPSDDIHGVLAEDGHGVAVAIVDRQAVVEMSLRSKELTCISVVRQGVLLSENDSMPSADG